MSADVRIGFDAVRTAIAGDADEASAIDAPTMKFADLELSLSPANNTQADKEKNQTANEVEVTPAARWKIHDISSKGVGLLVERGIGETVNVGQLLAIKPFGEVHWMLGVLVRKLTQRNVGETLLGVEILCLRPLPITLRQFAQLADSKPDPSISPTSALYLPGLEEHGRADILVMPDSDMGLKNIFGLTAMSSKYRLRINRVLRKETGWMGVRFEVLGKD
jgi:hypothetical protein